MGRVGPEADRPQTGGGGGFQHVGFRRPIQPEARGARLVLAQDSQLPGQWHFPLTGQGPVERRPHRHAPGPADGRCGQGLQHFPLKRGGHGCGPAARRQVASQARPPMTTSTR